MNLTIDRDALAAAVSTAATVVKTFVNRPVLGCVRLTAADAAVVLEATDLEAGVRLTVPAAVARPGEVVIPAARLGQWLKACPAGDVDVSQGPGEPAVRLAIGRDVCDLSTFDPKEFPGVIDHQTELGAATVAGADLAAAVARAAPAVADTDTTKWAAMCLSVELAGDRLVVVGCDGTECAAVEVGASDAAGSGTFLVLPASLAPLRTLGAEPVRVSWSGGTVSFTWGGNVLTSRLVSGKFAPWRLALDRARKLGKVRVELPLAEFAAAVRQVCVTDGEETTRLTCEFAPGELTLRATDPATGAKSEVRRGLGYDGKAATVHLDSKRLRAFLTTASAAKLTTLPVRFGDGTAPFLVEPEPAWTYFMQPLVANP